MRSELFLCEWGFHLGFPGDHLIVEYQVAHPKAKVDGVIVRKHFDEVGKLVEEVGYLLVRDSGLVSKMTPRRAVVVRALNEITPLPANAGRFAGAFQSGGGRYSFYVFDAKEESPSPRSSGEENTSPAPSRASDTEASAASPPVAAPETNDSGPTCTPNAGDTDAWSGW